MPKPVLAFTVSMSSGTTFSSGVDLGYGYNHISVVIPTMTSGTDIFFLVSDKLEGDYRRVYHQVTSTDPSPNPMRIKSSITNCAMHLEYFNYQFVKIEIATAMTATPATFKFLCSE